MLVGGGSAPFAVSLPAWQNQLECELHASNVADIGGVSWCALLFCANRATLQEESGHYLHAGVVRWISRRTDGHQELVFEGAALRPS